MKILQTTLLSVIILSSASIANETHEMYSINKINTIKSKIILNINKHIQVLEKNKICIQKSTSKDNLKECRDQMKADRKILKIDREKNKINRKAEKIRRLELQLEKAKSK